METGKLYVVYNESIRNSKTNDRLYKIGITKKSVDERYYGLGLKMPGIFETLFAYELEDYAKAELIIQGIFKKYREKGEWFNLNQKELDHIKSTCELMGGKDVTDEVKKGIENEYYDNENSNNHGSYSRNFNNELKQFEKLVDAWNNTTKAYKTSIKDNGKKYRRIFFSGLPAGIHYELQYYINEKLISIGIDNESNNLSLMEYMREWEKTLDIYGNRLFFKCQRKLRMDFKPNDIENIIVCMQKLVESTENSIKNIN